MYNLVIVIHIISIICCIYMLRIITARKTSNEFKYLMLSTSCAILYCFFSLMDLINSSPDNDLFFIQMDYICAGLLLLFFLIFITKFCHISIPKIFYFLILLSECIFSFFILNSSSNCFFRNIRYITNAPYPQIVYDFGILWWFYDLLSILMTILICFCLIYRIRKTSKSGNIKYFILLAAILCPVIIYILKALNVIHYYNLVPLGLLLSMLLIILSILRYGISNIIISGRADIINKMDSPIIITDSQYRLLDANTCARKTFPVINKLYKFRITSPLNDEFITSLMTGEEGLELEYNGHYYEKHISVIKNHNNTNGYSAMLTDTTQKHEYIEELNIIKDKALEASHAKSRFLANASHELRTPMNAIIGFSELILSSSDDETIIKYSRNINEASHALLKIINDILDSSKLEADRMEIICSDYNPIELIDETVKIIRIQAESKGLNFNVDVSGTMPSVLNGDSAHIKQILMNLLANAVKYTKEGYVSLKCTFDTLEGASNLVFEVSDSGAGIKEDEIPHLFEAFRQSDNVLNANIEGTGLGLSISNSLIKLMGGQLHVKSEYQKGSVFTALIPQLMPYQGRFLAPDAKILLVDDSYVNLMLLSEMLKEHKIVADTAFDGLNALTMIAMNEYDLVFLDHMMPNVDGIETLKRLRSTKRDNNDYYQTLPVIMLTANVGKGVKEEFLQNGASDYIAKPFDMQTIDSTLLRWLSASKIVPVENTISQSNDEPLPHISKNDIGLNTAPVYNTSSLNLKEIDFTKGMSHNGNSINTYKSILSAFINVSKNELENIDSLCAQNNVTAINRICHSLKNSAYAIGAVKLCDIAKTANSTLSDTGRLTDINLMLLKKRYEAAFTDSMILLNYIAKTEQTHHKDHKTIASDLDITLYLNNIIAAGKIMDAPNISKYLGILLDTCPDDKTEDIRKMISYADDFDYDKLIAACKEMVDRLHSYIIT